jgi:hypothetical protein
MIWNLDVQRNLPSRRLSRNLRGVVQILCDFSASVHEDNKETTISGNFDSSNEVEVDDLERSFVFSPEPEKGVVLGQLG